MPIGDHFRSDDAPLQAGENELIAGGVRVYLLRVHSLRSRFGSALRGPDNNLLLVHSPGVPAARAATQTIPIIWSAETLARLTGWVERHARPGGNVTGFTAEAETAWRVQRRAPPRPNHL